MMLHMKKLVDDNSLKIKIAGAKSIICYTKDCYIKVH